MVRHPVRRRPIGQARDSPWESGQPRTGGSLDQAVSLRQADSELVNIGLPCFPPLALLAELSRFLQNIGMMHGDVSERNDALHLQVFDDW